MSTLKELADLIFPDVKQTVLDLEKRYPERKLPSGAEVTRFAPSPTGFLHTGSLFTALVAYKFAKQTNGVYFFRLEDNKKKREVDGTGLDLVNFLNVFGVVADEGYFGNVEKGDYGPYKQSQRADIYKIVIKELIKKGRAYPDFCTKEELDALRQVQEANKVVPGYYGEYAKYRNLKIDDAIKFIKEGKPYVIRFKSMGDVNKHIKVVDEIRGELQLSQNNQDIVILKSDGLPTYHFAHLVDDHFMHTTLVTRGEEWIASLPIHVELFETMNWTRPKYAHLPVIMINDEETHNRRKLSKRKDEVAAVSYFLKQGYPIDGIIKYLYTIANSNFEEWLLANPKGDVNTFKLSFDKFSLDGALFDLPKLNNISKEVLALYSKKEFTDKALEYAKEYDKKLLDIINTDRNKFENIINIEREIEKPRKDYEKFSDVLPKILFFYNDEFDNMLKNATLPFNEFIKKNVISEFLLDAVDNMDISKDESVWFDSVKKIGLKHGFADDKKEYKANPEKYNGWYSDCISLIRIGITTTTVSPKLFDVIKILGKEEIKRRFTLVIKKYGSN